jgi:alanine racemase
MSGKVFGRPETSSMHSPPSLRAWVEVDLAQLRRNFQLINADKGDVVKFASVVKDEGYGHGAAAVSRVALECGASFLAVSNVAEAVALREQGIDAPILVFGERLADEMDCCLDWNLTLASSSLENLSHLSNAAQKSKSTAQVHIKVDSGMSRYGVRWNEAPELVAKAMRLPGIKIEGIMSHFAMSDELDKSFALLQLSRFKNVIHTLAEQGITFEYQHMCNSGGLLDLPEARFNLVRIGILPLGVYPSTVCRRIAGIEPIMSVKARIASIKEIDKGDVVGYGMRYTAPEKRRIAVVPLGYGDGFPRVRNQGHLLYHGKRASLVGGVSMDALTIDVSEIPEAKAWDEVTVLGRNGDERITIHDIAALKGSVSYDAMVSWRARLPRVYTGA